METIYCLVAVTSLVLFIFISVRSFVKWMDNIDNKREQLVFELKHFFRKDFLEVVTFSALSIGIMILGPREIEIWRFLVFMTLDIAGLLYLANESKKTQQKEEEEALLDEYKQAEKGEEKNELERMKEVHKKLKEDYEALKEDYETLKGEYDELKMG